MPNRLSLAVLLLALGGTADAFEAVAARSFYTDEARARLLLGALPDSLADRPLRADVLLGIHPLARDMPVHRGRHPWVEFPLATLPMGDSLLRCRLRVDGNDTGSAITSVTRLAPKANAVAVDRLGGGLFVEGLPFFPFGYYCYSPVQPTLAEEEVVRGFNLMSPYQDNDPATVDERHAYMDRAAQLGMKVHFQLLRVAGGGGVNLGTAQDTSAARREAWLRAEVEAFRDHPALLAWYISDEPTGHGATPGQLRRAYRIVRELDPYHPVTIVFMAPDAARRYVTAMDLAMTDPYPIPNGPPGGVADAVRTILDAVSPGIPLWLVPQAFGGNEWWTREPTAAELRLMTWLGVVEGATGVQYFIRHGLSGFPKSSLTWAAASRCAHEIAALTPHLLSPEARPAVGSSEPTVRTAAWQHDGEIVIAAVNTENHPLAVTLELSDAAYGGADVEVLFEDRVVPVRRKSRVGPFGVLLRPVGMVTDLLRSSAATGTRDLRFEDVIDAYGVRLYRLPAAESPAVANPFNILVDPSFEWDVAPAVPAAIYADVGDGRGATYFVDGRDAFHGRRALRLHTPRDGDGVGIRPYAPAVTPGRTYRFGVWARTASASAPTLRLQVADTDSADFVLSTIWQRYALDAVVPDGVTRSWLSLSLATAGTAWLDLMEYYDISPRITATPLPGGHQVAIESVVSDADVHFRLDGDAVTPDDRRYTEPIEVTGSRAVRAALVRDGQVVSRAALDLHHHAALGRFVDLASPYSSRYPAGGPGTLTDGILGTGHYNDGRWQGFEGEDLQAVIDLGETVPIEAVVCRFLQNNASWIWLPRVMEVNLSDDGRHFRPYATADHTVADTTRGHLVEELVASAPADRARYVRVRARSVGVCPDWHPGAGGPAWVFADEIRVNPE